MTNTVDKLSHELYNAPLYPTLQERSHEQTIVFAPSNMPDSEIILKCLSTFKRVASSLIISASLSCPNHCPPAAQSLQSHALEQTSHQTFLSTHLASATAFYFLFISFSFFEGGECQAFHSALFCFSLSCVVYM